MQVRVESYSGYKAEERPLSFYLGERRYQVKELVDQWYGPEEIYFRLRADDDNLYILRHTYQDSIDVWTLESFRRAHKP
ncbi:MAG: hypothetical protein DMG06_21895 [Acidobacteria bacterium]|nr:MAG: hypothetical protein DMG06_21895 [Acidobacteriota bacterium]